MLRIGDGDVFYGIGFESVNLQAGDIEGRLLRNPDDNASYAVDERRTGVGKALLRQLVRVFAVGGKEDVEWRLVANFGIEVAGRSVTGRDVDFRMRLAEAAGDVVQRELEVGCRRDGEFSRRGMRCAAG